MRHLLEIAFEKRAPLFDVTDAFRIVNGAADGFPGLTLDKFGDRFQIQYFGDELLRERGAVVDAVAETFNPACIVVKERLSFHVDLLDTVNPGLFLDMRHVRLEVEERFRAMSGEAPRFLNLFSYTCSFSVHARLGGAAVATNADISGKILDKGRENYALNGLDLRPGEFFRGNALEYVRWAIKKGLKFDGIVLDPPSFARFKGMNFNVREHLMPLVSECAQVLNPHGFIMVSSNYSEFALDSFARDVLAAVKNEHKNARTAWKRGQDIDFAGSGATKDSCLVACGKRRYEGLLPRRDPRGIVKRSPPTRG